MLNSIIDLFNHLRVFFFLYIFIMAITVIARYPFKYTCKKNNSSKATRELMKEWDNGIKILRLMVTAIFFVIVLVFLMFMWSPLETNPESEVYKQGIPVPQEHKDITEEEALKEVITEKAEKLKKKAEAKRIG